MRVNHVSVSYKRTQNLGNYSNVTAEMQLAIELDDGEPVLTAALAAKRFVRNHVIVELARSVPQLAQRAKSLALDLPAAQDYELLRGDALPEDVQRALADNDIDPEDLYFAMSDFELEEENDD